MSWHLTVGLCFLFIPFWFIICGLGYIFIRDDEVFVALPYALIFFSWAFLIGIKLTIGT